MEYVDGGGLYLSNSGLKGILLACAVNPLPSVGIAVLYWQTVSFITAKFSLLCGKICSFAGPLGTLAGLVLGALSAVSIAVTIVDALVAKKGIELGYTWRPTLEIK